MTQSNVLVGYNDLLALVGSGPITVLTGAGVSTSSGIPGYRDREGQWTASRPIHYPDFARSAAIRKRYWARSFAGWKHFARAQPNTTHAALASLERVGMIDLLITQNVDGLHRRAGSNRMIDLHGRLAEVRCVACGQVGSRADFQVALEEQNPQWNADVRSLKPDGDVDLDGDFAAFAVPDCNICGGMIKPHVVMFGESVPAHRVEAAHASIEESLALLIIGSSLTVYSGFRFARRAHALGKPVAIVNQGRTRADDLASLRIDADCADVLAAVLDAVVGDQDSKIPLARGGASAPR